VKENIASGQVQIVALDGHQVIGWCDILRPKMPALSHVGSVGIGILPEYRGRGIGRKLMETAIDMAFRSGIERIELGVYASNRNAIGLYRSLGFIDEGKMARKAKIDGVYLDMLNMVLFPNRAAHS
jgi:ribosomal protein S18 acetylase RimI-like enzyme